MKSLAIVKHGFSRYSVDEVIEYGRIEKGFNAGKPKYRFVSQVAFWFVNAASARTQFTINQDEQLLDSVLIYSQII